MSLESQSTTLPPELHTTASSTRQPNLYAIERGKQSQQRIADILLSLPDVAEVQQSEFNDWNDQHLADLIVTLTPQNGIEEPPVKVQSKSGAENRKKFRLRSIGGRLKQLGIDSPENRIEYMLQERIVCLNGGDKTEVIAENETGEKIKEKYQMPAEGIIYSFRLQVDAIRAYANKQKSDRQSNS